MADVIENYSPNTEWGKQHVELVLKLWRYEATRIVKVGGNCRGLDVIDHAVSMLADQLMDDVADDEQPEVSLVDPEGGTLSASPDFDEDPENWLKSIIVSARIVGWDAPTLNEVRAINGAAPVPDGDRLWEPL